MIASSAGSPHRQPDRPLLRGKLHLVAALLTPFGVVTLMLLADSPSAYVGGGVFAASLVALYTSSASYHLVPWPRRLQGVMKRVDHSMIFALIAGTYTPFCLVVLGRGWGISMLALVWSIAGAGMLLKIAWPYAPRWLGVGLYLGVGWLAIVPAWEVASRLGAWQTFLLLFGGALYSVGGVVYATRWPDPSPRVFGFHEVFHVLVVAGSLIHFALIAIYVL